MQALSFLNLKKIPFLSSLKIPISLFNFLYKNFFFKLVSLFAAIALSVYVDLQNRSEKVIRVPLSVRKMPAHLGLREGVPKSLFLTVFGRKTDLERLEPEKIQAVINLSSLKVGEHVVFPSIKGSLPKGIRLERLSPDRLTIALSQTQLRYIRVEPEFINEPKDSIGVSYTIKPNRVRIVGPEDIIKNILILRTEPIDLSPLKGTVDSSFEFKVKISLTTTEFIRFDRDKEYTVNVFRNSKYVLQKLPDKIPISLQDLNPSLEIIQQNPYHVSNVEVNLPKQKRDSFNPYKDITFFIDLEEVKSPGEYTVSVEYQVAEGIQVRSFSPKVVKIKVALIAPPQEVELPPSPPSTDPSPPTESTPNSSDENVPKDQEFT